MIVITITDTKEQLIKDIANYYDVEPNDIEIDDKDRVWCRGKKRKLQVDKYKNQYVCAFVA